jgi:hypothetical protein
MADSLHYCPPKVWLEIRSSDKIQNLEGIVCRTASTLSNTAGANSYRFSDYTPPLHQGLFNWLPQLFTIPDTFVLQHQSLDAFLFLRLLKMSVVICLVGCAITWPILFPINATGGGGQLQLDILNFGNVKNTWKYFAHVGCAYLFFGKYRYSWWAPTNGSWDNQSPQPPDNGRFGDIQIRAWVASSVPLLP